MKKTNRVKQRAGLLLAGALLLALLLPGCQSGQPKTEVPTPEEMAGALLDLALRSDSSALQALFPDAGAPVWDLEAQAQAIAAGTQTFSLKTLGSPLGKLPDGVVLPLEKIDRAALKLLSKLSITQEAEVEGDRAVLTFRCQTYDGLEDRMTEALAMPAARFPSFFQSLDSQLFDQFNGAEGPEEQAKAAQFFYDMEYAMFAEIVEHMEPGEGTAEFQAVFVPTEVKAGGQSVTLWLPEDAEGLGTALTEAALGVK